MAFWTVPFSLRALTRIYEIDDENVVRSRPSVLAPFSADEQSEHVSEITVQSTGNRVRGNVIILKNGREVFSWENVLWPREKRKMLEELSLEVRNRQSAQAVSPVQEPEPRHSTSHHSPKRPLVPGPAAILDTKTDKNS